MPMMMMVVMMMRLRRRCLIADIVDVADIADAVATMAVVDVDACIVDTVQIVVVVVVVVAANADGDIAAAIAAAAAVMTIAGTVDSVAVANADTHVASTSYSQRWRRFGHRRHGKLCRRRLAAATGSSNASSGDCCRCCCRCSCCCCCGRRRRRCRHQIARVKSLSFGIALQCRIDLCPELLLARLGAVKGIESVRLRLRKGERNSPLDGLQPILELSTTLLCDLECGTCCHNNAGKLLVVTLRQVIQLLVYALNVPGDGEREDCLNCNVKNPVEDLHLLAFLHQRCQRRAQMLHHQLVIVPAQIVSRLDGHVVQHKGADYRVDRTDAELVQILCAQFLANP